MTDNSAETERETSSEIEASNLPPQDGLLELLASIINAAPGVSVSFTVFIGAGVLTGDLISWSAWRDGWLNQMEGADQGIGQALREAIPESDRPSEEGEGSLEPAPFLHLRDAVLYSGQYKHHVPLWRGRLSQIDGWMMGRYSND